MSILAKKSESSNLVNAKEKNDNFLEMTEYKENLEFEVLETFSDKISNFIEKNDYQKVIEFTEKQLYLLNQAFTDESEKIKIQNTDFHFELPLKRKNKDIIGNINELIINEKAKFRNFFIYLKQELLNCKKFYFIVSFIRYSGIQLLISTLDELEKQGIQGEIITSVYLNITDSKALRKLLSYKNIKVKIYNNSSESFHTKAYLFEKEKYHSVVIGSSNISQSALYSAEEWNVKLTDSSFFNIYGKSLNQFEKLWHSNEAIELTQDFIDEYEKYKKSVNVQNTFDYRKTKIEQENEFVPNSMQKRVLGKLKETRENGNKKGLVISATGTGKTYLAAMDIKQFFEISNTENKLFEINDKKSKTSNIKFLFIAHREELLENATNVFSKILKIDKNEFGRIYGGLKEIDKNIIFASIQSLRNCYNEFKPSFFDYIIVDEFHHSMSDSYLKILSYFNPKFLLGLTATPKRMDGKDILSLCDYNIVDEIGIKEALEEDLVVPFHYFGVNDYMINYDNIPYKNGKYNEKILLENLLLNTRTDYIVKKINKFGFDGDELSAVAFCQNIEHAFFMKEEFLKKGYKSAVITANTSPNERSEILEKFKNKKIEILCVVDILNEGIDIPTINLLLFLRPTMSSTIFIQQIGRGLRKAKNKDFVTIIDFIGNHKKDYLLINYFSSEVDNKDTLFTKKEKIINEIKNQFSNIPKSCYVELDRICQNRIIEKIEKINFSSKNILKEMYLDYKAEIGKSENEILKVSDFDTNIELFQELSLKLGSFHNAQLQFENSEIKQNKIFLLNSEETEFLAYLEKKLTIVEPFTYLIVKYLINNDFINLEIIVDEYKNYFNIKDNFQKEYVINRIFTELVEDEILEKNSTKNRLFKISKKYNKIFENKKENNDEINLKLIDLDNSQNTNYNFKNRLEDLLYLGLSEFKKNNNLSIFNENILIPYKKYKRIELQILLDSKVPKGSWRAGYANTDKDICLFATIDKTHILQENLKYDNSLFADDIIQWISQPKTAHTSSVGKMFINHKKLGYNVHIFIRKFAFMDGNKTNPFIYLGKADYYKSSGDKPMRILWKLEEKIPQELIYELYNL
ncbi:DUF3427 domain-containing protein [Leptotrichia sp. oral taxon 417]|uniref:DUF3427 domain-containing protein n=1 Tax=Leptotrichia sp. oral taxon 417 TaxID=712365 RepID=UPI0015C0EDDD|nr:DUF3427 domain-containing protein [Leptotrichia sp. oral taxon 417]NWO27264.1 DUF3427 domain-containing protein [Leptotrichia sp. oral taxon 417]